MSDIAGTPSHSQALAALEAAVAAKQLSDAAAANIKRWLTESGYAPYAAKVLTLVEAQKWHELDGLFWEIIPFGTGGRRGVMAEVGSATMNERTVAESADGLAVYLQKAKGQSGGKAAIAYDTRHRSREF